MSDIPLETQAKDHPTSASPGQKPASAARDGESMLLVVEDEADDFVLLRRALKNVGALASVRWVQTASEALDVLAEVAPKNKRICVVADVKLPGIDGFDLLKSVKARLNPERVKFAFLTGRWDHATEERARASGADAFFVKPTCGEQLAEIARALQRMTLQAQLAFASTLAWVEWAV